MRSRPWHRGGEVTPPDLERLAYEVDLDHLGGGRLRRGLGGLVGRSVLAAGWQGRLYGLMALALAVLDWPDPGPSWEEFENVRRVRDLIRDGGMLVGEVGEVGVGHFDLVVARMRGASYGRATSVDRARLVRVVLPRAKRRFRAVTMDSIKPAHWEALVDEMRGASLSATENSVVLVVDPAVAADAAGLEAARAWARGLELDPDGWPMVKLAFYGGPGRGGPPGRVGWNGRQFGHREVAAAMHVLNKDLRRHRHRQFVRLRKLRFSTNVQLELHGAVGVDLDRLRADGFAGFRDPRAWMGGRAVGHWVLVGDKVAVWSGAGFELAPALPAGLAGQSIANTLVIYEQGTSLAGVDLSRPPDLDGRLRVIVVGSVDLGEVVRYLESIPHGVGERALLDIPRGEPIEGEDALALTRTDGVVAFGGFTPRGVSPEVARHVVGVHADGTLTFPMWASAEYRVYRHPVDFLPGYGLRWDERPDDVDERVAVAAWPPHHDQWEVVLSYWTGQPWTRSAGWVGATPDFGPFVPSAEPMVLVGERGKEVPDQVTRSSWVAFAALAAGTPAVCGARCGVCGGGGGEVVCSGWPCGGRGGAGEAGGGVGAAGGVGPGCGAGAAGGGVGGVGGVGGGEG